MAGIADIVSMDVPIGWEASEEDAIVSIYDPEGGVGALNVSLARRMTDARDGELHMLAKSFAAQRNWPPPAFLNATLPAGPAVEFSHRDGATYWQVWHISGPGHVAVVTYNCEVADAERESAIRKEIVESIAWTRRGR